MIAMTSVISALVVTVTLLSREVHGYGYTVIVFGSGVPVAMQTNTTDKSATGRLSFTASTSPLAEDPGPR
ncbi:MAG: hypothetical protein KDH19_00845 [Geminicoccaceae bacterium]|nr:hypothetical protein [Geminicoccaceae bacterium]